MNTGKRLLQSSLCGVFVAGATALPAHAQFGSRLPRRTLAAPAITTAPQAGHYEALRVEHVAPDIIAYWIDPERQRQPSAARLGAVADAYKRAMHVLNPNSAPGVAIVNPTLPAGIGQLQPMNEQNVLLAYGTDDGLARLRQLVGILDRPRCTIQALVRFVALDPAAVQDLNLGPDLPKSQHPVVLRSEVSMVPADIQLAPPDIAARLARLIANQRARLLWQRTAQAPDRSRSWGSTGGADAIRLGVERTAVGMPVPEGTKSNLQLLQELTISYRAEQQDDGMIAIALRCPLQFGIGLYDNESGAAYESQLTNKLQYGPVDVTSGQTLVLRGLRLLEVERNGQGGSYWSYIPGLGRLLDAPVQAGNEREVLVFYTITAERVPDVAEARFGPGITIEQSTASPFGRPPQQSNLSPFFSVGPDVTQNPFGPAAPEALSTPARNPFGPATAAHANAHWSNPYVIGNSPFPTPRNPFSPNQSPPPPVRDPFAPER
jgi:hypothetical protein